MNLTNLRSLETVSKSNALIHSLGRNLNIDDERVLQIALKNKREINGVPASEVDAYKKIEDTTGIDFTHGSISIGYNSDITEYLIENKKRKKNKDENNNEADVKEEVSGTYYDKIKEMMNPLSPKCFKNKMVLMIVDEKRNIYAVADLITATYYDGSRFLIKWSSEKSIQALLNSVRNSCKLPHVLFMSWENDETYKLMEILYSDMQYDEAVTKEIKNEYVFRYGFSQLKFLLHKIDPFISEEVQKEVSKPNPNYEIAEKLAEQYCKEHGLPEKHLPSYAEFMRNVGNKVKEEVDEKSDFTIEFKKVKGGKGGKCTHIDIVLKRKADILSKEEGELSENEKFAFYDDMRDIIPYTLKTSEYKAIAETAKYNMDKIKKATDVLVAYLNKKKDGDTVNITAFLIKAIRKNFEPPTTVTVTAKSSFNNIEQNDYDFEAIERELNGQ